MNVGLVIISDRGDQYLPGCLASLAEFVEHPFSFRTIVDDREHRLGMAGAVREGWSRALDAGCDFVFHVEEDFQFTEPVDVEPLWSACPPAHPLAQVVLKRQSWSPEERSAGGIVELHPDDYHEHEGYTFHQRIFSLNPCIVSRAVMELGWPDGNEAEMTRKLTDLGYWFAFHGNKFDPPRVLHVGAERSQGWRL